MEHVDVLIVGASLSGIGAAWSSSDARWTVDIVQLRWGTLNDDVLQFRR